jgi:hypothetical protein
MKNHMLPLAVLAAVLLCSCGSQQKHTFDAPLSLPKTNDGASCHQDTAKYEGLMCKDIRLGISLKEFRTPAAAI